MADLGILADTPLALALREPELLVPGEVPTGRVAVKPDALPAHVHLFTSDDPLTCLGGLGDATNPSGLIEFDAEGANFTGTLNERIEIPHIPLSDKLSVALNFRYDAHNGTTGEGLFSKYVSASWAILIWVTAVGDLKARITNSVPTSVTITIETGFATKRVGQHVCVGLHYDGATMTGVINGFAAASASQTGVIQATPNNFIVGNYYSASWDYAMNGKARLSHFDISGKTTLDEVKRYTSDPFGSIFKPANDAPYLFSAGAGGSPYTLTADAGSFSLTGQAAALRATRTMAANAGSFSLTGQAAGLKVGRNLPAASGSFSIGGQAAGLKADRLLSAAAGSYALTGQAAGLRAARVLTAAPGAYTLTGVAATLTYVPSGSYVLTCDAGAFSISGNDAALVYNAVTTKIPSMIYISAENRILAIASEKTTIDLSDDDPILKVH